MPQNLAAQRQNAGPASAPQPGTTAGAQGSTPALAVSAENLKRINTVLTEVSKQINDLETRKANGLSAEQAANTDTQFNQFRSKACTVSKGCCVHEGSIGERCSRRHTSLGGKSCCKGRHACNGWWSVRTRSSLETRFCPGRRLSPLSPNSSAQVQKRCWRESTWCSQIPVELGPGLGLLL
ncbi:predicted protein [Meyerozyma guilliermondii ATCC 6260]|uniref:Uncharacterized protein n=1 Tax=Meyerozyma guilliermondii (strain ATCC 6260 / CBS 566 / DSM 6381 / JCM 1539 / NBRC 10279 / NRRL Y-324) TaxID=294746 RepID=A5DMC2_PICGU|nr:uncharacterized protein PGUG_04423 [Meyerozyma guilliermondii ATCC 6260]EDK40325.2 predicted protein [Meyerozyma guilliermondii ATCC 6260]